MFNINPLKFLTRTRTIVVEAYKGASKMGKGKKLNSQEITADFEKFENFFYQDSHVFGIITCIADSMSESGLSFVHEDNDLNRQANDMVSEYAMDTMVSELTVSSMVFGNSFIVLDPANPDFDFLEQLSPRYIAIQKDPDTGRHNGWKYNEGGTDSALTREDLLYTPLKWGDEKLLFQATF